MKNLLNNAVNELVIRVNEEYDNARKEIKVLEDKGLKLNALYERRHNIKNLLNKLDILKDKAKEQFPEEDVIEFNIDKFKFIMNIQLEDMLDIVNEAYVGVIEEEYEEC